MERGGCVEFSQGKGRRIQVPERIQQLKAGRVYILTKRLWHAGKESAKIRGQEEETEQGVGGLKKERERKKEEENIATSCRIIVI